MQISDLEISQRMELLELDESDLQKLAGLKEKISAILDAIVDEFYTNQTKIDEIALLIGDSDTMSRLRQAQYHYVLDLFSGEYGTDYVNNRLRIGMVHKRIGVEPKLYLSAIKTLKEILSRVIQALIADPIEANSLVNVLDKLIYFDTTLVFDTYIQGLIGEIESAKRRTEVYALSLEQKVAERTQQLEELARTDSLTGLYNRRAMSDFFERELASARRRKTPLSCVYFDVDKFKIINDEMGHLFGDDVLKSVANAIKSSIREIDIACRYGGDEFCLILPQCIIADARRICNRIIAFFNEEFPDYSLSVGISEKGPEETSSVQDMIEMADNKMYQSKGKDGSHISH